LPVAFPLDDIIAFPSSFYENNSSPENSGIALPGAGGKNISLAAASDLSYLFNKGEEN
jgi:hypothetical protein